MPSGKKKGKKAHKVSLPNKRKKRRRANRPQRKSSCYQRLFSF